MNRGLMMLASVQIALVGIFLSSFRLLAQFPCPDPQWFPGDGAPGTNGVVRATTYLDPDGPGPISPKLVLGGTFTFAGTVAANCIALYDLATGAWSTMGSGMEGTSTPSVFALATLPNGDLVAGGDFTIAGGEPANRIARWSWTSGAWAPMGSGFGGVIPNLSYAVHSLATLPNGDLVAGGFFMTAGGVAANNIARWNGTTWFAMGAGIGGGNPTSVRALLTLPSGDLVVGGNFTSAGGISANRIARWNGSGGGSWAAVGSGVNNSVYTLATLSGGDLVAGGDFTSAGGVSASRIARWNDAGGGEWAAMGTGVNNSVYALATLPSGDLIAGGAFTTAGGASANRVARWSGVGGGEWSTLGLGVEWGTLPYVRTLTTLPDGELVAGGAFIKAGGLAANYVARWSELSGGVWTALGSGTSGAVSAFTTLPSGELVAGGAFITAGGIQANYIARRNATGGGMWSALGSGMNGTVHSLVTMPSGDLVAGGAFTSAGGVPANRVACWDGTAWSALGSGMAGNAVYALAAVAGGDLVAGGSFTHVGGIPAFSIARWNGSAWSSMGLGMGGNSVAVYALTMLAGGDLVAGGAFTYAGGNPANRVARWNETEGTWSTFGAGLGYDVYALVSLSNGDLIVGGTFSDAGGKPANRIARWDGTAWSAFGSGMGGVATPGVYALATLPGGDIIAGGYFTTVDGVPAINIARWSAAGGGSWSAMGLGMNSSVGSLMTLPSGSLVAGGAFTTAGGQVSAYFARYGCDAPTPCYPDCDASGGLDIDDFICFQTLFALGDPAADCDESGTLDIDDFICFQTAFAIGC